MPAEIDFVGGGERGITRYGNFVVPCNGTETWSAYHLREFTAELLTTAWIDPGRVIGYVGSEGFGTAAQGGRVKTDHPHVEYRQGTKPILLRTDARHPLGRLPRTGGSNVVSVARSTATDPDGVASHRLIITSDQPLATGPAVNEVLLIGNLATRTLNFDTLVGFNPSNVDDDSYDGIFDAARESHPRIPRLSPIALHS